MLIFWCTFANSGNHNSVSTNNTFEAQRRARELGASKLFFKNTFTGIVGELEF
jgi:hypothetical protein